MATTLSRRNKAGIAAGIVALLGFGIYVEEVFVQLFRERAESLEREQTRQSVALSRARLEAELFRNTYLSDTLASFITMDPDLTASEWEAVAEKLFQKSDTLRNIGIAPGDVIAQIYPYEGNEKALGFDYRTAPEQMRSVRLAREMGSVYIAGPVALVQGGSALIARFPIFRDYPNTRDYWGTVSAVMNFDALLDNAGLNDLQGASIALSRAGDGEHIASGEPTVIYGDPAVAQNADIQLPVNTPSGAWQLSARFDSLTTPSLQRAIAIIRTIALLVLTLIIASILLLLRAYHLSRQAALIDELTQVPNRRFIMGQLHRLVSGGSRPARFAVLLIDLNRFKEVNDTLGHEAGDALLVHVANALQRAVRAGDSVARLGGDEFIAVLHRVSEKQQAEAVIEKIRTSVESNTLVWHEDEITPSISIGYSLCHGQDTSVKELLAKADESMYRAKAARLDVISPWR
ncbi:sensor domain-containing diguanylate cyclase [Parahaliea maris]|uniref:Sensor domain-containing diguanylate cyclase n=1 Tax=Parahaliea maris TaxID=2716870 RepID=A0A5C9A438_9GAMM|nr:diguanylate cyclase [Parahaliea maris]TXS95643.1 sensor domain-containing diguanylate cyclase [Parahaliea maris]